jgi:hypothetical protein
MNQKNETTEGPPNEGPSLMWAKAFGPGMDGKKSLIDDVSILNLESEIFWSVFGLPQFFMIHFISENS